MYNNNNKKENIRFPLLLFSYFYLSHLTQGSNLESLILSIPTAVGINLLARYEKRLCLFVNECIKHGCSIHSYNMEFTNLEA